MLSKITAKNFMSWKNLEFTVTPGATLIDGWNEDDQRSEGSGKSAILNAIAWSVFGKLPKDANVDEVIKDGESSCSVVLEFDNGDAIVRSRKPNDLYILKSGATIKGKDARETQSFIEEYIGCNFETFCQSVYFAQNYDKKFLSSNQEDKGKILSSIQNLQVFDKARKEAMDLLKIENDNITKLKSEVQLTENNAANLKTQQAMLESFIADKIKKHLGQLAMIQQQKDLVTGSLRRVESDIQMTLEAISSINVDGLQNDEKELNDVRNTYSQQLSDINYQKSQINSTKATIMAKENEGKILASRHASVEQKLQALNPTGTTRYVTLKANRDKVLNVEQNPSRIRLMAKAKQLEDFIANPTKTCPSCGTELTTTDTSHTQTELASIYQEIEEISVSAQKQAQDIEAQMNAEIIAVGDQSTQLAQELTNIVNQLVIISEYLDQNKIPSLDELNSQEAETKDVIAQVDAALLQTRTKKNEHTQLSNQYAAYTTQKESYENQLNNLHQSESQLGQPDVQADENKLTAIVEEQSVVTTKLSELAQLLNKSQEHAQKLEALKEGFKEIKSYVFTNALNELNFRTNQYLNELFDMEASIKFSNEDQKIESKITLNGNDRGLGLLSGGQARRFNLAVDLALADIVAYRRTSKLDLLIFDEYFKDLSEISMEKSLGLLKDRKCPVILIEHNSIFKNIVDNTFMVRLENGTSYGA